MDDEGLVAEVDDAGDSVAGLESGHRSRDELPARKVLDRTMVIAVLQVLEEKEIRGKISFVSSTFPHVYGSNFS